MYSLFRLFFSAIFVIVFSLCSMEVSAQANWGKKPKKMKIRQQNYRTASFTGKRLKFANSRQYMTLGLSTSAYNYFGDITPSSRNFSTDISFTRPGFGINTGFRMGPQFSLQTGLMWGRLKGSDFVSADPTDENAIYRYTRNLQFRNDVIDFSVTGVFDLIPNRGSVFTRAIFTPYVLAGVSVFHHNPMGKVPHEAYLYGADEPAIIPENAGEWVALKPLQTEGPGHDYSNFQISVPVGFGIRQQVTQMFDIEFEFAYRFLFFDYLDDVSGSYPDKGVLSNELAKIMSDRSREPIDAVSGEERIQSIVESGKISNKLYTYTGADGQVYTTFNGYGQPGEIRGNPKDNDIFITTTIRLVYMLGRSPFESKGLGKKRYSR